MSIYGEWKAATIGASNTDSAEVDLGRDYDFLEVQIPTIDKATLKLKTAEKTGGTFKDLGSSVTTADGTHNYHDVWGLGGWQFIQVIASNSQTAAALIRVRGMRY